VGVIARPAGLRRRLVGAPLPGVAVLVLVLLGMGIAVPALGQAESPPGPGGGVGAAGELVLVSADEVLSSRCGRIHEDPLHLLFLLPGLLFLIFAAAVRRRRGLLAILVAGVLLAGALAAGGPGPASLGAGGDGASLAEASLRQAEQSFAAGRVEEALGLYREAGAHLPCSPALEHNLGVCYAAAGEVGYAVLHLRRSLRARPADKATRRALATVEQAAALEGQLPMPVPVNPDVLFVMTLVLANLSLGAAGFALRHKGVRALIVLVLLTIAAGISLGFFLGLLNNENRPVGVVVAREVGLLKIPEDEARASFVLPPGTSLRIRGQAGEYYLVETASRFRGWARREAIVLD